MRRIETNIAAALCLLVLTSASVEAQSEPPGINLGATSFLDGAPPGPGVYFFQYFQDYSAREFKDANGQTVPFPDPRLNVQVSISQVVILFDQPLELIHAKPALDLLIPTAWTSLDYSAAGPFPQSNGMGLSDITVGPALQFDPIKNDCGRTIFSMRLEAQFIVPTGKYSDQTAVNPGSGFFSFDPYWAGTLFLTPKWEVSYRAHYLWNARLDDPPANLHAESAVVGEAFHINFASSYEVIEKKLRIGFNGYFLDQTTATEVDDSPIPGRERVLGIGPGLMWRFGPHANLIFNYYIETAVTNGPEGNRLNLLFMYKF
jgi:hypothetical protein